jgi:hypothetical protein
MKNNKKHPLAFVKEMPESEEVNISRATRVSHEEIEKLLQAPKPKQKAKK